MLTHQDFTHRLKDQNYVVQHKKISLISFHLIPTLRVTVLDSILKLRNQNHIL